MPVSRRQALAIAGGHAGLHLPPTGPMARALAQDSPPNPVAGIASVMDFEPRARERMTRNAWEYINGGAGDEIPLRWNREAWDRIRLRTRVLVDVSKLDTRTRLFGQELAHPILLAPTAYHKLVGCRAICVTVDTPLAGARNREERAGFALPPGLDLPHLKGLTRASHPPREGEIFSAILDPTLTWKDIEWLRSFAKVPVLLKGIQSADDADQAAKAGVSGIIVSNHGARNLDTVPATIDSLPGVVEKVAGRMPVLVDGGIRRGTDVLKALASGASAVLIGRPYLYALGVAGAPGVARALSILRKEFEIAMALTGRRSIAEIDKSVIW